MIQVKEGKIISYSLPKTGTLKDGASVSGYDQLDKETLKAEGWLPLADEVPEYDESTHFLEVEGYEVLEDKVVKTYKVTEAPARTGPADVQEQLLMHMQLLNTILGGEEIG